MATQKKKTSGFQYKDEPKPASVTSGSKTVTGRDPITPAGQAKKINLNQAATNEVLKRDPNYNANALRSTNANKLVVRGSGSSAFVDLPNGSRFTGTWEDAMRIKNSYDAVNPGEDPELTKIKEDVAREKMKQDYINSITPPNVSEDLLNNVGVITPEQQAFIDSPVEVSRNPNLRQIASVAGERAAIGATGGALTGAGIGAVASAPAGGVGAIPGAAIGGVIGGVGGAVSGVFASLKTTDMENADDIQRIITNAQYNIDQSITAVNRGGNAEFNEREFNNAKVALLRARNQLKAIENNREWATKVKDKQTDIEFYLATTLRRREEAFYNALQRPDPNFINSNYNVNQKGDAVRVE